MAVVVLLLTLAPHGGDPGSVSLTTWLIGLAVTLSAIAAAAVAGRWVRPVTRTALAGIAAGMTAGLIAVLVKPVTTVVGRGLGAVVAIGAVWLSNSPLLEGDQEGLDDARHDPVLRRSEHSREARRLGAGRP